MTATDERTAGTAELAQVAPGSLAYVTATAATGKWDLAKVAGLLVTEAPAQAEAPVPDPLQPTEITPELRAALDKLATVFGSVVPTEARRLEAAELKRITEESRVIAEVVAALGTRAKAIDNAVRSHMDAFAPEGTPVIADGVARGHRLLATEGEAFRVAVDGYAESWEQRLVRGKAEVSIALLADLLAARTITQAEFNALTVPVREIDPAKVRAAIRRKPARFLAILRAATTRKPNGAQLVSPKK